MKAEDTESKKVAMFMCSPSNERDAAIFCGCQLLCDLLKNRPEIFISLVSSDAGTESLAIAAQKMVSEVVGSIDMSLELVNLFCWAKDRYAEVMNGDEVDFVLKARQFATAVNKINQV